MPTAVSDFFADFDIPLYQAYGLSETSGAGCLNTLGKQYIFHLFIGGLSNINIVKLIKTVTYEGISAKYTRLTTDTSCLRLTPLYLNLVDLKCLYNKWNLLYCHINNLIDYISS